MEKTKRYEFYLKLKETLSDEQCEILVELDDEYGSSMERVVEEKILYGRKQGLKAAIGAIIDLI